MRLENVYKTLLLNKNKVAKRKKWKRSTIKVYEIGWANQYGEPEKPTERNIDNADKFYMQLIEGDYLRDEYRPSIRDVFANDWEIISE